MKFQNILASPHHRPCNFEFKTHSLEILICKKTKVPTEVPLHTFQMGRRYYLDFGVMSGFTCFLLGLLGLRARRQQLLPNRNYISGKLPW